MTIALSRRALLGASLVLPALARAARAAPLDDLVAGAKRESELRLTLFPRVSPENVKQLEATFNKRYGINVRLVADLTGSYSTKAAQGVIEHRTGAAPSYDVMILPESAFMALDAAGAVEPIANWESMLPEGANATVSPRSIAGRGFKAYDLFWGYSYNPDKIAKADLPRTLVDLANPKYAGKMAISNFATNWTYATLRYPPDELLKIAAGWGKNGIKMLHPTQMAQQVALGEFAIGLFQTTEQITTTPEVANKVQVAFLSDVIPQGVLLHAVRRRARAPNAAKLFTLWATGRESVTLVGESTDVGSELYPGNVAIDLAMKLAKEQNLKPVGFFDSDANYERLRWLESADGRAFTQKLTDAIRGQ